MFAFNHLDGLTPTISSLFGFFVVVFNSQTPKVTSAANPGDLLCTSGPFVVCSGVVMSEALTVRTGIIEERRLAESAALGANRCRNHKEIHSL